jgi:hypothetical protein
MSEEFDSPILDYKELHQQNCAFQPCNFERTAVAFSKIRHVFPAGTCSLYYSAYASA